MRARGLLGPVSTGLALAALTACGGSSAESEDQTITLYTCVSDTTIQPLIDRFETDHADSTVNLYRAPTGDLNARVAADVRSGGLKADVIWACDPLTMHDYAEQDLVGGWLPESDVAADLRTPDAVGAQVLYMVAVSGKGVAPVRSWADLTGAPYTDGVAVPDPAFAASALGALGYFAQDADYGLAFYQALKDNGAEQVSTPDDVTTGVAEGVYRAGMTIANSAYLAQDGGSPIEVTWPDPGAIAVYGPIAIARHAAADATARDFVSFVVGEDGQRLVGESGSYPALAGVPGPTLPQDAPVVAPDWDAVAGQKDKLLADYQQIFGG